MPTDKIALIQKIFTGKVKDFEAIESGEDNLVIVVNCKWIFRFLRNKNSNFGRFEKKFLLDFEKVTPIPIPKIKYSGRGFFGYRKIEGELLTRKLFDRLSLKEKDGIAHDFGKFLSAIHSFPAKRAKAIGMSLEWNGWRRKAFASFKRDIIPLLPERARRESLFLFDEYFDMEYKPVVVHGDFYPPDHIFYDARKKKVAGIIDFSDLTLEDPAQDFISIYRDFGPAFFEKVCKNYIFPIDAKFMERLKLRIRISPLFDSAYAVEYKQPDKITKRVAEIKRLFQK